jgi:hypothetical protein
LASGSFINHSLPILTLSAPHQQFQEHNLLYHMLCHISHGK